MGSAARNATPTAGGEVSPPNHALKIVFFTVFLDLIGFGIIIPIQPFFAESLGAAPSVVTLLGASFSLMQFLFAPVWGRLSDRVGRRPVMLVSIFVTAGGYLLFGLAHTLTALFVARMIAGLGSANIGTAQAIIADSTTPEKRAKGMGLIGAAFGLGFIFGPALGGVLVKYGLAVPAYAASILCAINFVFAFFYLPETRKKGAKSTSTGHVFSLHALKHASRHPGVPRIFLLYLVYTTAFSMMEQVLGLFIEKRWLMGITDPMMRGQEAGSMTTKALVVVGIMATIVQGGLIGKLAKRFGENTLLISGLLLVSLSLYLIPVTGNMQAYPLLIAACGLMAVGSGLVTPSLSSLLSRAVDGDEQGGVLGLGQGLSALGRVFGPSMAGLLFETSFNLPFFWSGSLVLICFATAFSLRSFRSRLAHT